MTILIWCCLGCIVIFLQRILRNVHDYNELVLLSKEYESLTNISSLWMPTIRGANKSKRRRRSGSGVYFERPNNDSATKDFSDSTKYWRYDEAAPPVRYATTQILDSFPLEHRISSQGLQNLTAYLQNPNNTYPNKMHWFEFNPSITILPERYRIPIIVNEESGESKIPYYLGCYRYTFMHNCFDYLERKVMYNDWNFAHPKIPEQANIGFALLDEKLQILSDVTTVVRKYSPINGAYRIKGQNSDYRVVTLRDKLYFTTKTYIGHIELGSGNNTLADEKFKEESKIEGYYYPIQETNLTYQNYRRLPPLKEDSPQQFSLYLQKHPACIVPYEKDEIASGKNILHFIDSNTNQTMAIHYPDPLNNNIRQVDLATSKCVNNVQSKPDLNDTRPLTEPSFHNYHEEVYPLTKMRSPFLIGDRGSACCIRLTSPYDNKEYLVGVVHPKTPFPGKALPNGVLPNIYLSRFIAFESHSPYKIVARTGAFCLGYSTSQEYETNDNDDDDADKIIPPRSSSLIWKKPRDQLFMGEGNTFECPRIHFVMSIIDDVMDPSQAVISYGVGDCTPRIVVVHKADIQSMLWP